MSRAPIDFGDLTIPLGATESNIVSASSRAGNRAAFAGLVDFVVEGPATLPEGVTVWTSHLKAPAWSDMKQLNLSGTVPFLVGPGESVPIPVGSIRAIGLLADAAVGADRVFHIYGQTAD